MKLRRKIKFKKLGVYEDPDNKYIYPLEEFLEEVGCAFIAGDGLIKILVDGEKTNIIVPDWIWWWWEGHPTMPDACVVKKIEHLRRIEGEVEIVYSGK